MALVDELEATRDYVDDLSDEEGCGAPLVPASTRLLPAQLLAFYLPSTCHLPAIYRLLPPSTTFY